MPSGGAFPSPPSPTRRKLQLCLGPYPHASTPGCAPAGLPLQSGACALGLVGRKWSSGFLGLSPCGRAHYLGKWPWDRQSMSRYRRSPESLWFTLQRQSSSSGSKAERVTQGDRELRVCPLSRALCTSLAAAEIRHQRSLLLLADRTLPEHWLRPPLHRDPTALHSGCLHSAMCVLSYPSPPADRTEVHFMKLARGCIEANSSARFAPFAEMVCLRNANSSYLPKNRELGPQITHSLS